MTSMRNLTENGKDNYPERINRNHYPVPNTNTKSNAKKTRYSKPLSREKIANAAIDIVQQDGASALSMRKIAGLFDVDVAALYRHFRNKDELFQEIGLIISDDIILELATKGSWENRFLALAGQIRERINNHPELGIFGGGSQWSIPFFSKANGLIAELFCEAGLKDEQLVFATQSILHLVISIAQSEVMTRATPNKQNRVFAKTIADHLPEKARQAWPSTEAKHAWSIDFDRFFETSIKTTLSAFAPAKV